MLFVKDSVIQYVFPEGTDKTPRTLSNPFYVNPETGKYLVWFYLPEEMSLESLCKNNAVHLVVSCKPDQVPVSLKKSVYCAELENKDFITLPTGLKEVEDDLEYSDYKRPFYGSLKTFTDSGYKVIVGPEVDRIHAIIIDPLINLTITESFVF